MEQEKDGTGAAALKGDSSATKPKQGGDEEDEEGQINPSAPEDSNTTPGTTGDK